MEILALIFIATGLVLLLVAKNVTNYLPPNYMGDAPGRNVEENATGGSIGQNTEETPTGDSPGQSPGVSQQSDDGFAELLQTMGRLVRGVAYVFFLIGAVCLVIGLMK
jgi:hypothetical protein